ncbi:hypothetical protein [Microbacterium sp. 3J1]|uniref:hypothetical protein n=1 Tax=Microbacterium sp. 3J1 TaxID=861269 RepID=UPI000A41B57B|nr:hypothetical protein [Microbacterium sp. 3J1]
MSSPTPSGADQSRDYYSLTYQDPTGEAAIRNLMGRSVQVTWENGASVHLDVDTIRPLLAKLNFRMSRRGHIWGTKKSAPDLSGNSVEGEVIRK